MDVLQSSNGRKLAMALSGQLLLVFLLAHALGNASLWRFLDALENVVRAAKQARESAR